MTCKLIKCIVQKLPRYDESDIRFNTYAEKLHRNNDLMNVRKLQNTTIVQED